MNKKILLSFLLSLCLVGCKSNDIDSSEIISEQNADVLLTFDSYNAPSLASEVDTFETIIKFSDENEYVISYSKAIKSEENHITLNDGGYIKNKEGFPGISSIIINYFGGTLKYCFGYSSCEVNEIELASGASFDEISKYSYFKVLAVGEVTIKDITFVVNNNALNNYQYVESYENDHLTVIETKEFIKGSEIDVSSFKNPSSIYYEDKELEFLGFALEEYENVIDSFILGDNPVALYPVFQDVQRFSWSYDIENKTYTSLKAGVRPINDVEGKLFGRYSVEFEICNKSTTGIGLIWNALLPDSSYPYSTDCSYYYFHLNPNNGGCQFSKVENGIYTALKTYPVSTNKYWNTKWNKWNSDGRIEPLNITMTSEFTSKSVTIYIDGSCIANYTNIEELILFDSTVIGIRTNSSDNVAKNFKFVEYIASKNGFNEYSDGSYVSYLNNVSTVIPKFTATHLKFSADMTITSTINNVRSGLMIRAHRLNEESIDSNWTHQSGYYLHHNLTANVNFTATSIYDETYSKHPDGTTGNIGSISYNSSSIGILKEYHQENTEFYEGLSPSLTIRLSFELTNKQIAIYLNNNLIFKNENSNSISYFDGLVNNTGVGFVSGTYGVMFSNLEVIDYDI